MTNLAILSRKKNLIVLILINHFFLQSFKIDDTVENENDLLIGIKN